MVGKISSKEWVYMLRMMAINKFLFAHNTSELAVFDYILFRTIWYHKFDEWFMTADWFGGRPENDFFTFGSHRSSVLRAFNRFGDCNLAQIIDYDRDHSRYHIVLNAPGMLEQLQHLAVSKSASACIASLVLKTKKYFMEKGWRSDMAYKLDDVERIAGKKSEEAKLRRKKKREGKELKVQWIYGAMMDYAAECEVPFSDTWTKKTYGQARNWLDYCKVMGQNPREVLYDIVNFWPEISESLKPKNIYIGGAAGFEMYYKYRRQIDEQLAVNREMWENDRKSTSKIIYISHRLKNGEAEE